MSANDLDNATTLTLGIGGGASLGLITATALGMHFSKFGKSGLSNVKEVAKIAGYSTAGLVGGGLIGWMGAVAVYVNKTQNNQKIDSE